MPKIQASAALSRFKVLDLSRVRAGPNCVRILTDFGADVVRVEPPEGVDPNEAMFAANRKGGDFQNINRNKRSMTLNLKKEGAMDILKRMIAEDALVEPAPGAPPLSMTTTLRPALDSSSAIDAPITPPPMMTMSL